MVVQIEKKSRGQGGLVVCRDMAVNTQEEEYLQNTISKIFKLVLLAIYITNLSYCSTVC